MAKHFQNFIQIIIQEIQEVIQTRGRRNIGNATLLHNAHDKLKIAVRREYLTSSQ